MNKLPTPFDGNKLPASPGLPFRVDAMGQIDEGQSPLLRYWEMIVRGRYIIGAIVGGFLLLGLAVTFASEKMYTASARLQVDRNAAKVVDIEGLDSDARFNLEFYQTQYELLRSRALAERVVDTLALDADDMFLVGEEAADVLAPMSDEERRDLAVDIVRGSSSISPVEGSSIVDVRYTSADPVRAAAIANAMADEFIDLNFSRRFDNAAQARLFLKEQLDDTRATLEESERQAADLAKRERLVTTTGATSADSVPQQSVEAARLARLTDRLAEATVNRVTAEADYRADMGGSAAASVLGNEALNALRRQRAEKTAELAKLESDFGPEYPRVKALSAEIGTLDQQIESEQGRVGRSVRRDLEDRYRRALAAEDELRSQVRSAEEGVLDTQQRSIALQIVQRDVDTNRALYEALLQRYKEVGVAGGVGINNVMLVDDARVPQFPSSPNMLLNLVIALALGMSTAAAAVIILDQVARSKLEPRTLSGRLGVPLLGSTPLVGADMIEHRSEQKQRKELGEAYFSAMAQLQFSTDQGTPASLLVTSTQKGEGKSTTAISLARDLAKLDRKVLLIDADLRDPSMQKILGRALDAGLSDILAGRTKLKDFGKLVVQDTNSGLAVMMAGTVPPNPAELLYGPRMAELIQAALSKYDHVVIDGPPVLGLADAPLLSRSVDGTVFVVESDRTPAARAQTALQRLMDANARVIGAIITKYNERTGRYGYGYGYGYGQQPGEAGDYRYGH